MEDFDRLVGEMVGGIDKKPASHKKETVDLAFERTIIACAEGLLERGDELTSLDRYRLMKAVERVQSQYD